MRKTINSLCIYFYLKEFYLKVLNVKIYLSTIRWKNIDGKIKEWTVNLLPSTSSDHDSREQGLRNYEVWNLGASLISNNEPF